MTKVVDIRRFNKVEIYAKDIVYVGRPHQGKGLQGHVLANPFVIGRDGDRDTCVRKFREKLLAEPDLIAIAKRLKDKTLGCWCEDGLACHARVIAEIADFEVSKTNRCPKCGQIDEGQTGEYPCVLCGLPTTYDKEQ